MCLAVLGNPDGWYVRDLKRAALDRRNTTIDVIAFSDLQVSTALPGPTHVSMASAARSGVAGFQNEPSFDAILVRTMPLGTLEQVIFRMNALHVAQSRGVNVVNSPRSLEIAIDKWLTLDFMRRADLAIPRTIVCQTREAALEGFELLGGDVVVKPLFGGEGRGIMRVDNLDMAWRAFSTLEQLGAVLYLQEFLPHHGYDLRLLVIGQKILSVARHAPIGDWRTNLSRGGEAVPFEASEAQIDIARKAATAIGGSIVGVDILPTKDGRDIVLEVNAVPGWRGTAKALGIDVASKVLESLRNDL
jgi:RimK family alpha-L-glutamate ligase